MRLTITHRTHYRFEQPKRSLTQSLRLWPTEYDGQEIRDWSIDVEGHPVERGATFRDGAGDRIETLSFRGVSDVTIAVHGTVETRDLTGVVRGLREKISPTAYLRPSPMTLLNAPLRELSDAAIDGIDNPLDRGHALARAVNQAIRYQSGTTAVGTTAAQALDMGQGVCQDQTHALIAVARAAGIPARYVTGYLHANADGTAEEASHAWAELWIDEMGWVGFDAANACCPDDKYVRVGSGLDSTAAAPIRGIAMGTGEEHLDVEVAVLQSGQQQQQNGSGQSQQQG